MGLTLTEFECKQKGLTYAIPIKAKINLVFLQTGEIRQKEIYMGDIPLMTDRGTFIINGAERVVVSQMHRSPGVIFSHEKGVYSSRIIPYRGSWLEFEIDQKKELIYTKIDRKKNKVVVEGAGQHLFEEGEQLTDASGNVQHKDIGLHLKQRIKEYFDAEGTEVTIKYIDPSYIIRSAPANTNDSLFCNRMAYQAVHGAMAGKTKFVVGRLNNQFVYLPISKVVNKRKKIDLEGEFWFAALQSTGQPFSLQENQY